MATTSLWHIKGRLGDLIDYVENPEKTVPKGTEDFFNVFEYVRRPDKTTDQYVDAINCRKEIALQLIRQWKKAGRGSRKGSGVRLARSRERQAHSLQEPKTHR